MSREAEVSQLHIVVLVQEYVGRLEISMNQSQTVQVMQGVYYLREYLPFQVC